MVFKGYYMVRRESLGELFVRLEVLIERIFRGWLGKVSYLVQGLAPRLPSKECKLWWQFYKHEVLWFYITAQLNIWILRVMSEISRAHLLQ